MKSTSVRKKERELQFFLLAQTLLPELFPLGTVDGDGESPDVVVQTPLFRYGVEVTELMDPLRKHEESQRAWVCWQAQKEFKDLKLQRGMRVSVAFLPGAPLFSKSARSKAAKELRSMVARSIAGQSAESPWTAVACEDELESAFFQKVWVHFHPAMEASYWHPIRAWSVRDLSGDVLAARIQEKDGRIAAYRMRAKQIYLLLVVYGFEGSSAAQISDKLLARAFSTEFDGIVLLDWVLNKAHVLNREIR